MILRREKQTKRDECLRTRGRKGAWPGLRGTAGTAAAARPPPHDGDRQPGSQTQREARLPGDSVVLPAVSPEASPGLGLL